MSFTAVYSRCPADRANITTLLQQYRVKECNGNILESWDLGTCWVEFVTDSELFLSYRNTDTNKGAQFCVLIMGYIAHNERQGNGPELAEKLFRSWKIRGTQFLDEIEGSFSIFIHDIDNDKSLIATDCIASRMLWHSQLSNIHIIGTDLTAIANCRPGSLTIDEIYLWSFLRHARTISTRSFFREISSIGPGHAITSEHGQITNRDDYFTPLFKPNSRRTSADFAAELVDSLSTTIREACDSRTKPALFLSGGLDSRLLAGLSPDHVTAVTLCDHMNTEVAIAKKIATKTGLHHEIIYRDPDWYPSLMEEASERFGSIWGWTEAHYIPLKRPERHFDFDTVMLGFGCDTYFKGLHLKWPRLWEDGKNTGQGLKVDVEAALNLVMQAPYRTSQIQELFQPDFDCKYRNEFRVVAEQDIKKLIRWCDNAPDLWELFWDRSMVCVPEALNLVCLRNFTSERNIFSSPRLRKLSLTIPPKIRASGDVIRHSLKQVGKGLSTLPDASSMLPPLLPYRFHKTALRLRGGLSSFRGRILAAKKSTEIAAQSAWTRFDRLIVVDERVRSLLLDLINDNEALPDRIFDKGKLHAMAGKHVLSEADYSTQLVLLMTFGLYHRKVMPLLK